MDTGDGRIKESRIQPEFLTVDKHIPFASNKQLNHIMRILCGCGASFKRSGLKTHQQRSNDPLCLSPEANTSKNSAKTPKSTSNTTDTSDPAIPLEPNAPPTPAVDCDMEVDPIGDYFGDYSEYSLAELGLDEDEGILNDLVAADDDEEVEAFEEILEGQHGHPLEPERHNKSYLGDHNNDNDNNDSLTQAETGSAMRLRGGAESGLGKKPHVVKFTKGKAGTVYSKDGVDLNTEYTNKIGVSDNPYRPFSSKIEWEIARWAKTRGPSSTAFTELMNIEGVCSIHYRSRNFTNKNLPPGVQEPWVVIQELKRAEQDNRRPITRPATI